MNKKRLIALAVCMVALFGLMRYRSQSRAPLETTPSDPEPPASVAVLENLWPENGLTESIPVPPGTVSWAMEDEQKGICAVQLLSVGEKAFEEYYEALQSSGYQEIEQVEGEPQISIGTLLSDGEKTVSLAYSGQTLVITLTEQGIRGTEKGFLGSGNLVNVYVNGYATYDTEKGVQVVTELYVPESEKLVPELTRVSGWVILILNGERTVHYLGTEGEALDAAALAVSTGITGNSGDRGTVIIGGSACADNAAGGAGSFAVVFDITIP